MNGFLKKRDAGLELMGRGTGVPYSLCTLADCVESALKASGSEVLPDSLIVALGAVLLQRRADQAESMQLRQELRDLRSALVEWGEKAHARSREIAAMKRGADYE